MSGEPKEHILDQQIFAKAAALLKEVASWDTDIRAEDIITLCDLMSFASDPAKATAALGIVETRCKKADQGGFFIVASQSPSYGTLKKMIKDAGGIETDHYVKAMKCLDGLCPTLPYDEVVGQEFSLVMKTILMDKDSSATKTLQVLEQALRVCRGIIELASGVFRGRDSFDESCLKTVRSHGFRISVLVPVDTNFGHLKSKARDTIRELVAAHEVFHAAVSALMVLVEVSKHFDKDGKCTNFKDVAELFYKVETYCNMIKSRTHFSELENDIKAAKDKFCVQNAGRDEFIRAFESLRDSLEPVADVFPAKVDVECLQPGFLGCVKEDKFDDELWKAKLQNVEKERFSAQRYAQFSDQPGYHACVCMTAERMIKFIDYKDWADRLADEQGDNFSDLGKSMYASGLIHLVQVIGAYRSLIPGAKQDEKDQDEGQKNDSQLRMVEALTSVSVAGKFMRHVKKIYDLMVSAIHDFGIADLSASSDVFKHVKDIVDADEELSDEVARKLKALHKKASASTANLESKFKDVKHHIPEVWASVEQRQVVLDKGHALSFTWAVRTILAIKAITKKDKGKPVRMQLKNVLDGASRVHKEKETVLGNDTWARVVSILAVDDEAYRDADDEDKAPNPG